MNATSAGYKQLLERFSSWAQGEENIRAAFVFGSRAREDRPADEWSDLDLLFLAERPQIYMEATDWLLHIGNPWLSFLERTPDGGFERRVLFEGGLDVDFVPASIAGFRQQLAEGLPAMGIDILRRGELWWAKSCCDSYLKNLLLQMLELHARASNGPDFDTWMRGRFLEAWADPRAVAALPQIFAHYEEVDIGRALLATMELFRWLALETADILGYAYPIYGDERCSELVQQLLCSRPVPEQTGI